MARQPSIDASGAAAIKPPRENIFAKPEADARSGGAGPFDQGAACARAAVGTAPRHASHLPRIGWSAMTLALIGVAAVLAAIARPSGDSLSPSREAVPDRPMAAPAVRRQAAPTPAPRATSAPAARARRDRPSHRPPRRRRSRPRPSMPRVTVPVVPAPLPRAVPARPGPTGPHPAPVPVGSPPEFM